MPPTSNHMYHLVRRGPKTYHVPSSELKKFQNAMVIYPITRPYIPNYRKLIKNWVDLKYKLQIHCGFYFRRDRLYTKEGKFKKLDVSNRLKAAHDGVAKMLGIDDSAFFRISAEKYNYMNVGEEMFSVEISPL